MAFNAPQVEVTNDTGNTLPTTDAATVAQSTTTSGQKNILMAGAVTTAAPTYVNGQTNPVSLTPTGAIRVDGTATTQPVSGTVGVTQTTSPWVVDGSAVTQPVNLKQVGGTPLSIGQQASSGSIPVVLATDQTSSENLIGPYVRQIFESLLLEVQSHTSLFQQARLLQTGIPAVSIAGAANSNNWLITSTTSTVQIAAPNMARIGLTIYNNSTSSLYLLLAMDTSVSSSNFTLIMTASSYYEVPFGYTGPVMGAWISTNGNAQVTEILAN